ncbi:MAG: hypothetical protein QNJ29_02960 [Rhizobiaceae bacterium]|nr:hypothetical protein [Rhizobiaceae bacterium]
MIQSPGWLYVPYIANIIILVPVCWSLFFSGGTIGVFEGKIADSEGLRLLVASLYLAILVASICGLFLPAFFAPLILIQIFYKTCWLLVFIWPLVQSGQTIPSGISLSFLMIIITYPIFFWLALK